MIALAFACTGSPVDDTAPIEEGTALGPGEGALDPGVFTWTTIVGEGDRLRDPRDLGFDPDGNLWIANREDDRTFIVSDPGTDAQALDVRRDGYAEHFMEETMAFSFESMDGAGVYGAEFGSCGESRNTYNDAVRGNLFMGPVLWTANLAVFAAEDPFGLGSHLDMLHQSPNCMGIAWEADNVYWVFDGFNEAIVRYDFVKDHDIGQDDHSDGIVLQLEEPTVTRVEGAPSHMAIDHETGLLYVADTGAGRVLVIDTQSGEEGRKLTATNEPLELYAMWNGVDWYELVTGLDKPGGLALADGVLYVAEWGNGVIHAYDLDGVELQSLDTGRGAEAINGIEVGPDGRLWVVDHSAPGVFRLDR